MKFNKYNDQGAYIVTGCVLEQKSQTSLANDIRVGDDAMEATDVGRMHTYIVWMLLKLLRWKSASRKTHRVTNYKDMLDAENERCYWVHS